MYRHKLGVFGIVVALIIVFLITAMASLAVVTNKNIHRATTAQSLLAEYQELSSISFRLFKQMTDEILFDDANKSAEIKFKISKINSTFQSILLLEKEQQTIQSDNSLIRAKSNVEELQRFFNQIVFKYDSAQSLSATSENNKNLMLRELLQVTIDSQYSQALSEATSLQTYHVVAMTSKIQTTNTIFMWLSLIIGLLLIVFVAVACVWLFNHTYRSLLSIKDSATAILNDDLDHTQKKKLDREFQIIADVINQLSSKIKKHRNEHQRLTEKLEVKVEERTNQLSKVNVELTKNDSRRKLFLADLSHELRTPITIIRGEAQVTLRQPNPSIEICKNSLKSILDQSLLISRLIEDLLFLTRTEMDQINLERTQENLFDLVSDCVERWERNQSNREIELILPDTLRSNMVFVDRSRITQVLSILLDNAIKYSVNKIVVSVVFNSQRGLWEISVTDFGKGISKNELQNIFKRFVRFSKKGEGLGLGLPIAKSIIEAHGGKLTAHSELNKKTVFTFTIFDGE